MLAQQFIGGYMNRSIKYPPNIGIHLPILVSRTRVGKFLLTPLCPGQRGSSLLWTVNKFVHQIWEHGIVGLFNLYKKILWMGWRCLLSSNILLKINLGLKFSFSSYIISNYWIFCCPFWVYILFRRFEIKIWACVMYQILQCFNSHMNNILMLQILPCFNSHMNTWCV